MKRASPRIAIVACLVLVSASGVLSGCGGEPDGDGDESMMKAGEALVSSDSYNRDGVEHRAQEIGLKNGSAPIRDLDFNPIGKVATGRTIRIQGIEAIESPGGMLYYAWGEDGNPSGHVHVSDLVSRPEIYPDAHADNGASCPLTEGKNGEPKSYFVRPEPIEGDLHYRGPTTGNAYDYKWYGTPGAPLATYTYLSWSWIDRAGGGIVRALVHENDVFYPCAVKSITHDAIPPSHCPDGVTCANGSVTASYGMVSSNGHRYYGWVVHSHQREGGPVVLHVAERNP